MRQKIINSSKILGYISGSKQTPKALCCCQVELYTSLLIAAGEQQLIFKAVFGFRIWMSTVNSYLS